MPSPFPGMDPYLEGNEWHSFHAELSAELARQLGPKLRPKYVARAVRRFVMDSSGQISIAKTKRTTIPDTGVFKVHEQVSAYMSSAAPQPVKMATVMPEKVPVYSVEIRDVDNRELVTAIEILSPTNKRGEGFKEYVSKRNQILSSSTHLLEIDLLRQGNRVPMQQPLPDAPYFVFLSRVEQRPVVDVWPIQMQNRLPIVPVPLLAGDADVALDLQVALNTVYDDFSYDLSIDYCEPPDVGLEGETAVFAQTILEKSGAIQDE
ncbi:MAG: DUF4058 family protein [Chloroflexi bacterium]|nr:MAG: DUF4058 family protein [Chloroflexota bacterium]